MNGSATADRNPADQQRTARLTVAALRRVVAGRMWGGKGCGAACDFCRVIVGQADVEYEIEAELDGQRLTLHFHRRCHEAWKAGRDPTGDAAPPEIPERAAKANAEK